MISLLSFCICSPGNAIYLLQKSWKFMITESATWFFVADGWEGGTKRKAERYGCGQELRTAHCHCCSGGSNKRQLQEKRNRSLLLPDNPSHSTIFWWMEPGLLQNYAAKKATRNWVNVVSECHSFINLVGDLQKNKWLTDMWLLSALVSPFVKCSVHRAALCDDSCSIFAMRALRLTYKTCQMRNWRAGGLLGSDSKAQQWEECCNNWTSLLIFLPECINHPIVKKTTLHFRRETAGLLHITHLSY